MTTLATITTAVHTAYLDPMTGYGMLVLPRPEDDVADPLAAAQFAEAGRIASLSLHEADWTTMLRRLWADGWEVHEEDDGYPFVAGYTADGRDVFALYGREPVITEPSLEHLGEADAALRAAVGLV